MTDGRQKQTLRIASASIAAILEKHKEGMSNRAIAKLFKMSPNNGHNVVKEVIENALVENGDSPKSTTPEVSTSTDPDGIH
ncbi:helix-turn-helix domain-containing protein [Aeromonas veronii]|uniref:helix-turn-helix domain-containing protein n=1 Tax=Aeromonas veronii TaxID=654 RepID=UPI003BA3333F